MDVERDEWLMWRQKRVYGWEVRDDIRHARCQTLLVNEPALRTCALQTSVAWALLPYVLTYVPSRVARAFSLNRW